MIPYYQHQRDEFRRAQLTKEAERERMEQLAREREARTPGRITPSWISPFWKRLLS